MRIPSDTWKYDLPPDRVMHLDRAPDGLDLLFHVADEIQARADPLRFVWEPACEKAGYYRARALIPCSPSLFDWMLNGPTGYRAHYYHSEVAGESFNLALLRRVVPELVRLDTWPGFTGSRGDGEKSFRGPSSKLALNKDAFQDAPILQLLAPRWLANRVNDDAMGLRAPRPPTAHFEIAGTWLDPLTGEVWLSPDKTDRSSRIHHRGFA